MTLANTARSTCNHAARSALVFKIGRGLIDMAAGTVENPAQLYNLTHRVEARGNRTIESANGQRRIGGGSCRGWHRKKAGISAPTLINFEKGETQPSEDPLLLIQTTLENLGIEFLNSGSPGVRLRPKHLPKPKPCRADWAVRRADPFAGKNAVADGGYPLKSG